MLLDDAQAEGAVAQRARQDDTDDARAELPGRGAEQRIDCRAEPVLARPADLVHPSAFEEQVDTRPADVDAAVRDAFARPREGHRQGAHPLEDAGQHALAVGARVHDDEHRRLEVAGQPFDDCRQRPQSARRGADDDNVMVRHAA